MISTVTITNTGSTPGRSVAWVENTGGALMLMDRLSATEWSAKVNSWFGDARAFAERRYTSSFSNVSVGGAPASARRARTGR